MGIVLRITQNDIQKYYKQVMEKHTKMHITLKAIGNLVQSSVMKNFEVEGRPRWRPLAKATLRQRGSNAKILQDRGKLRDSINFKVKSNAVEIGTNRPYAAIHQFGGYAGRGRKVYIPARPYLLLQKEDKEDIKKILKEIYAQ
jgi:phage virion morphogenesis protein